MKYKIGDVISIKQDVLDKASNRELVEYIKSIGNRLEINKAIGYSYASHGHKNGPIEIIKFPENCIAGYYDKFHNYNLRNQDNA